MRRAVAFALAAAVAYLGLAAGAKAQGVPCNNVALFSVTTTPLTQIIQGQPNLRIGLCSWYGSNADTNKQGQFQFFTGSGVNCADNQQPLTNQIWVNYDAWITHPGNYAREVAPLGNAVCIQGSGSAAGIFGGLYYVYF